MVEGDVPGGTPEAELTPDQRVDAAIESAKFGQAGLGSLGIGERLGTGGGGAGGQYMFADLAELDGVLAEWTAYRDRAFKRIKKLDDAVMRYNPPAGDDMSHYQVDLGQKSLIEATRHEQTMHDYADAYVQKLTAARASMAATEQDNTDRLRATGQELGHA